MSVDEAARRRFEAAWKKGEPGALADHLPDPDDPGWLPTLCELVPIDLEFRWRRRSSGGAAPLLEDYLELFEPLRAPERLELLIEEEWYVRHRFGDRPELLEYGRRFPGLSLDPERMAAVAARATARKTDHSRGPYRVEREFARGGFGLLFQAEDPALERVVALKQLSDRIAATPEFRRRFLREARIAAHLEHPGVVPVYALHEEEEGAPYYTMKLVKGETLAEAIQTFHRDARQDRIAWSRLLGAFLNVVRTMAFAHDRQVIHRDLKPANVVLGEYGETIILDWGLAKQLGRQEDANGEAAAGPATTSSDEPDDEADLTLHGSVLGTPAYMSPEQAEGNVAAIDTRSDVYALGTILYEILTGERIQSGDSSDELLEKVRIGEVRPPRALDPSLPRPLESICMKAVTARADGRYADAGGLAADLERYLADQPVSAHAESLTEQLARWSRRHRRVLVTAALGLLLLTLASVLAAILVDGQRRRAERAEAVAVEQEAATGRALEMARAELYVATLNQADAAWQAGRRAAAVRLLASCPEQHRGWEWHLLDRRINGELLSFEQHSGPIAAARFSPGGEQVASAGGPGGTAAELLLWDARDGSLIRRLGGHAGWISSLDFSPDGKLLLATGGQRQPDRFGGFHPAGSGEALLFDLDSGSVRTRLDVGGAYIHQGGFSRPTGRIVLLTAQDVAIHDPEEGTELATIRFRGDNWGIPRLVFDQRGDHAVVLESAHRFHLIHIGTGQLARRLGHPVDDRGLIGLTTGGGYLAAFTPPFGLPSRETSFELIDLEGRPGLELWGHRATLSAVAFSPDRNHLASAGVDGELRTWQLRDGKALEAIAAHDGPVTALEHDHGGRRLLSGGGDGRIAIRDPRAPGERRRLTPGPRAGGRSVALHPDGSLLVDPDLQLFRIGTGEKVADWGPDAHPDHPVQRPITKLAWSPDGGWIAVAEEAINPGETVGLHFLDADTGRALESLETGFGHCRAMRFLADGRLAMAGDDGLVRLFTLTGERSSLEIAAGGSLIEFTCDPDGTTLVSAGNDGTIRLFALATGDEIRRIEAAHAAGVGALAISADGERLASGGADGSLRIWSMRDGSPICRPSGHQRHVVGLAFTEAGDRLLSLGVDHTLRVWDPITGREILSVAIGDGPETAVACFAASGDRRVLAIGSTRVHVLEVGRRVRER